jgi:hypothetical protein
MSEHGTTGHPIGAFVMVLMISVLVTFGIGAMNNGDAASAAGAGVLLFGFGSYAVLSLAKD